MLSIAIGNEQVNHPKVAVTDFALPNIYAILSVYDQVKLRDYLQEFYNSYMNKVPVKFKTVVTLCQNHLIPVCLKTARSSPYDKIICDTVVASFMLVLQAKSIEQALQIWKHTTVVYCSREDTAEVEESREFLEKLSRVDVNVAEEQNFHYDFDDETNKEEEVEYGNRKLLRENSPFYKLFKRVIAQVSSRQKEDQDITNKFFAPQCLELLAKQYLSFFPLVSASVLEETLMTNTHIELYWKNQRQVLKNIPDRLRWPPRYFATVLKNVQREAKVSFTLIYLKFISNKYKHHSPPLSLNGIFSQMFSNPKDLNRTDKYASIVKTSFG